MNIPLIWILLVALTLVIGTVWGLGRVRRWRRQHHRAAEQRPADETAAPAPREPAEATVDSEAQRRAEREAEERADLLELERLYAEAMRAQQSAAARRQAERTAAERAEFERLQGARLDAERIEAERIETGRQEAERPQAQVRAAAAARSEPLHTEQAELERAERERSQPERAQPEAATPPPPAELARADTVVLVVDDSKVVRIKTQRLLAAQGYRIVLAESAEDAIAKLDAEVPHVLVTDAEMPGMDGFQLTRRVRGTPRLAHLPVIMITSADDRQQSAAAAGVSVLLGKPYSEADLIACIERGRLAAQLPASAPV